MSKTGWVFRVEIVTKTTPWTKDVVQEIERLLKSSSVISQFEIEEMPGDISLFKMKTKQGEEERTKP